MTGTTVEGRQAYAILSWANDDPARRAREARARIDTLARGLVQLGPGPALREVRDVGTVIQRLADAVAPVALSHSIYAQVIDMADWDPLKHPRDEHGKFIKKGELISDAVKAAAPDLAGRSKASVTAHDTASRRAKAKMALGRQARALARSSQVSTTRARGQSGESGPANDIDRITQNIKNQVAAPSAKAKNKASRAELDALSVRLNAQIAKAEDQSRELEKNIKEEKRAELGVEIAAVVAGAAFAFFSSKLGLGGGEAGAALALGPYLLKTALEKIPEVVTALAKFNVIGKGHGLTWFAHPVRKPAHIAAAGAHKAAHAVSPAAKSTSRKAKTISSQVKMSAALRRTPPPQPSGT